MTKRKEFESCRRCGIKYRFSKSVFFCSLECRFLGSVKKSKGCWLWLDNVGTHGYGQISIKNRPEVTHRVSWELHRGKIPAGICVLHRCDNRRCVNPDHLFLGTRADNQDDMAKKGRAGKKYAPAQVRKMRRLFAAGHAMKAIAREMNTSDSVVAYVVKRIYHKYVE